MLIISQQVDWNHTCSGLSQMPQSRSKARGPAAPTPIREVSWNGMAAPLGPDQQY